MNAFQWGICTFKFDKKESVYKTRPFNFYVFPQNNIDGFDQVLQYKMSNIKFLINHHFDFNKLFDKGIGFRRLDSQAEVKRSTDLKLAGEKDGSRYYSKIGQASKERLKHVLADLHNFIEDNKQCSS